MALDLALANPNGYAGIGLGALRPWLTDLVDSIATDRDSLGVLFTSDRGIREMNREYRGRDRSTDVISFPGERTPAGFHLGDVVISVPTAQRQAREKGHPLERELKILLLHGVLHCLGYDHETDDGTMDRLETELRRDWVPAGDLP